MTSHINYCAIHDRKYNLDMIKLWSEKPYKSIPAISELLLPNLFILTGINGAGKSQLFEAIQAGDVHVDEVSVDEIAYIPGTSFYIGDSTEQTAHTISSQRENYFAHYTNEIHEHFRPTSGAPGALTLEDMSKLRTMARKHGKGVHDLVGVDFGGDTNLIARYAAYLTRARDVVLNAPKNPQNRFFQNVYDSGRFFMGELDRRVIGEYLVQDFGSTIVLPSLLSATIFTYAQLLRDNEFSQYLNDKKGQDYEVLSEAEFEKRYGPKPWEVIDTAFSDIGASTLKLGFDFTSFHPGKHSYRLEFVKKNDEQVVVDHIGVNDLSSGEKAILALICSFYNSIISKDFPKMLLLDEVDASLHPSMVRGFISMLIEKIAADRDVRVGLITHSPTTVALVPEEAIYLMSGDRARGLVVKESRERALEVLSEGFVAITEATSNTELVFKASGSAMDLIFCEGVTDQMYLTNAARRINNDVFDRYNLQYAQGAGGLDLVWKLIRTLPVGQGLAQGKKTILLYDGDSKGRTSRPPHDGNQTLVMDYKPGNPIKSGIENLFPQTLVTRLQAQMPQYFRTNPDSSVTVDDAHKVEVAQWVIENANNSQLKAIIDVVRRLDQDLP